LAFSCYQYFNVWVCATNVPLPHTAAACKSVSRGRLSNPERNQLLRRLPELAVYKIGGEAAQECELVRFARPDLEGTRLQGCKERLESCRL
jgi:hypothetical protein